MCRQAAFPPNFPRQSAIDILKDFEGGNKDGVGYTYIQDNKFITHKTPDSLSDTLKENEESFLSHMPHKGWTIAHLRAASHGDIKYNNTHPFIINEEIAVVHNGVWSEYNIAKLLMQKTTNIKFTGETDSEVAAQFINLVGPDKFCAEVNHGGVFLILHKSGKLISIKTSGELSFHEMKDGRIVMASTMSLRKYKKQLESYDGWYEFSSDGKYVKHKKTESEIDSWVMVNGIPKRIEDLSKKDKKIIKQENSSKKNKHKICGDPCNVSSHSFKSGHYFSRRNQWAIYNGHEDFDDY